MKTSTVIISLLMLGFVFTGSYWLVDQLISTGSYSASVDPQYVSIFNDTNQLSNQIDADFSDLRNTTTQGDVFNLRFTIKAFSLLKNLAVLPYNIGTSVIATVTSTIGVPSWFSSFLLAMLIVLLFIALVVAFIRFDKV